MRVTLPNSALPRQTDKPKFEILLTKIQEYFPKKPFFADIFPEKIRLSI